MEKLPEILERKIDYVKGPLWHAKWVKLPKENEKYSYVLILVTSVNVFYSLRHNVRDCVGNPPTHLVTLLFPSAVTFRRALSMQSANQQGDTDMDGQRDKDMD